MEWPKLKNIILIILVLTNLFLLGFVLRREFQDSYLQRQTRDNALRFLAGRGVEVAEEQVPDQAALVPRIVERDLEREGTLAVQILGGSVQVEAPGGGVYRYFNENGVLQFHNDGVFSGEFLPGTLPVGEDWEAGCLDLLAKLDFAGELLETDGESLTFRQLWEGQPLFNQQVTLELQDGCLVSMTAGRRLMGEPEEDPASQSISVATALISFLNGVNTLGDVCSRIDAIEPGYVSAASLSGPMTLTPVWRVFTDTGAYQLDMVTGDLSRVL